MFELPKDQSRRLHFFLNSASYSPSFFISQTVFSTNLDLLLSINNATARLLILTVSGSAYLEAE